MLMFDESTQILSTELVVEQPSLGSVKLGLRLCFGVLCVVKGHHTIYKQGLTDEGGVHVCTHAY